MSKPTLSQMVELNRVRSEELIVVKDGRVYVIDNDRAVMKFGDVMIENLDISMGLVACGNVRGYKPELIVFI